MKTFNKNKNNKSNTGSLKTRFQILAGIIKSDVVATLKIPKSSIIKTDTTIEFVRFPKWYDILKYKICGFQYEKIKKSSDIPRDMDTNKSNLKYPEYKGDGLTSEDLDEIITELNTDLENEKNTFDKIPSKLKKHTYFGDVNSIQKRLEALKNAKNSLEEAFTDKKIDDTLQKVKCFRQNIVK